MISKYTVRTVSKSSIEKKGFINLAPTPYPPPFLNRSDTPKG